MEISQIKVEMYFNFNRGNSLFNNVYMWHHDPEEQLDLIKGVRIGALETGVSLRRRLRGLKH